MASIKIEGLTEQETAADDEYLVIGKSGAKKIKWSAIVSLLKGKLQQRLSSNDAQSLTSLKAWVRANCSYDIPARVLSYGGFSWNDCPLGTAWGTVVVFGNESTFGWFAIAYRNDTAIAYWNILLASTGTWAFGTWKEL